MSSTVATLKYFPNDTTSLRRVSNGEKQLEKNLTNIVTNYPPRKEWPASDNVGGIYCGSTGIAYLFMTTHRERPNLTIAGKSCHEWANLYLERELPREPCTPGDCGILNEPLCYSAVYAAQHKSDPYVDKLISHALDLIALFDRPDGSGESDRSYEYCYGLAGSLYLLRLVRTWYPDSSMLIDPVISEMIDVILKEGPPWVFKNRYTMLGPGHGDMGIIFQIVKSDPSYATHPKVLQVLQHILDEQLENGNWPVCASDAVFTSEEMKERGKRQLVQWCHGAPGIVQCLVQLAPFFPDFSDQFNAAIEKGRAFTWKEGLLIKEPNQCHGITGNAFTFPPDERREHFLSFTTEEEVTIGLENGRFEKCDYGIGYSLGFGAPGRAIGWLWRGRDAAKEGRGCYLTFDDI